MANVTRGGFQYWGSLSGGVGATPQTRVQEVANNYGTGIFRGDVIIPVSDGTLAVGAAANNGLLLGVAIGFSYVLQGRREPAPFIPASTTFSPTTVGSPAASLVEYIPLTGDTIFSVDADDGVTATTIATQIALIGENADLATGSGNTTTGVSAMALDISTHATTTANFRIIGIDGYTLSGLKLGDNDPTASRFKFLVVCNEGFLPPFTATGV